MKLLFALSLFLSTFTLPAAANTSGAYSMDILVDGRQRAEYSHKGQRYIEAVRDRDYTVRLTNNTSQRVAVALSVDGLNTIDAKHTTAWAAAKWVLDPYETTEISGWQVQQHYARSFFFTTSEKSYGEWLGDTRNLGVITAVFFREKTPQRAIVHRHPGSREPHTRGRLSDEGAATGIGSADASKHSSNSQSGSGTGSGRLGSASGHASSSSHAKGRTDVSFESVEIYDARESSPAATGIGGYERHSVGEISMSLDRRPVATLNTRYEFGEDLAKMGIIPRPYRRTWQRRYANGFAPDPG